jgi:hypothetical protein
MELSEEPTMVEFELPDGWVLDVFCTWTAWAHNKNESLGVREDAGTKEEALKGLNKRMNYLNKSRFLSTLHED